MINRPELKARGLAAFKNNYGWCVLAAVIVVICSAVLSGIANIPQTQYRFSFNGFSNYYNYNYGRPDINWKIFPITSVASIAISVFALNPLMVGVKRFFTVNAFEKADFSEVGFAFKDGRYMNIVKVMFMKNLFIFLWTLLFVIPGIIKTYEYFLVDYIITEDPTLSWQEALDQSKEMMNGYKMDTFVLQLSFIGWILLGGCTCYILYVAYVAPYMSATEAELFLDIRGRHFGPNVPPYHQVSFAGGYGNFSGQPGGYNTQAGYGQPYTPQQNAYGQTTAPQQNAYGQPYTPQQNAYGQPAAPQQDPYGQPAAPQQNAYGQPVAPQDPYAQPTAPQDPYGQPTAPQDPYSQPATPQDPYGQPSAPVQNTNPDAYYGQEPDSGSDKPFGIE